MTARLAVVTCRVLPEPDPDQEPLLAALERPGLEASLAAWDDPAVDWSAFDLAVLRSTWDYSTQPDAFRTWLRGAAERVPFLNPPDVVEWNLHKSYLLELTERGVPATPTELVRPEAPEPLADILARRAWSEVVVKPAVSAGSRETMRVEPGRVAAGQAHLAKLLAAGEEVLVQEYQASVEDYGERSLVWIDGAFTHAIRKTPRWKDDDEAVSDALPIPDDERALGAQALERWRDRILYGRVDLARDAEGVPRVMELELIEPSLFLVQGGEGVLRRLADAMAARAQSAAASRANKA